MPKQSKAIEAVIEKEFDNRFPRHSLWTRDDIKAFLKAKLTEVDKSAREEEYTQETIPMFDSLFTDGEYRKSFYEAVETRIKEINQTEVGNESISCL